MNPESRLESLNPESSDIPVTVNPESFVPSQGESLNSFDRAIRAISERITQLEDRNECRDLEDDAQWQTIQRLEGEIATLRAALGVSNKSLIESNNAILEMQSVISGLRSRVVALEINAKRPELNAGDGSGHRYSIDPPSSGWGP